MAPLKWDTQISNQSAYEGDRLSQKNVGPLHAMPRRKFVGNMPPQALIPTQSHVSGYWVKELGHEIKSQGMRTPIKVEYTHEKGDEGHPQAFIGDGHHRRQASFHAGMNQVPVEGYAYHGYDAPAGTRFVD